MNAPLDPEQDFWLRVTASRPGGWLVYEHFKKVYQQVRPDADHVEYEAAMKRLAEKLGV